MDSTQSAADMAALMVGRDTSWYKGHQLKLCIMIWLVLLTSMTNGYDGSMMNGLQTLDTWKDYFNNPQGSTLGLFNAIQTIGGLVSLPFGAWVSDTYGRRFAIALGSFFMLIGVGLQTGANSFGMFIGARALIGFGLTFATTSAPILVSEIAFPTHRATYTSIYNGNYSLGAIVAAWTTYGTFRMTSTWSWRIPSLLQGLSSGLQFALIWFIPESPRWLVDHGKDEQAKAVFAKYHCGGNWDDPLVAFEYEEIKVALELEKATRASGWESWKSMFVGKPNLKRMRIIIAVAFFSQWSGNGLVSYYLSQVLDTIGITTTSEQALINGILQLYNFATCMVGAYLVDRAGRRKLFMTSTGGMCLVFVVWTACSAVYSRTGQKSLANSVLAMIFLYDGFFNIGMCPLLIAYTVEILPFRHRAQGLIIMQFAVDCALVFNQYVNPIALEAIGWKYYIAYCVWLAVEFVFLWRYVVETKGSRTLEEIAAIFDGEDSMETIQRRAAREVIIDAEALRPTPADEKKDGEIVQQEHASVQVV